MGIGKHDLIQFEQENWDELTGDYIAVNLDDFMSFIEKVYPAAIVDFIEQARGHEKFDFDTFVLHRFTDRVAEVEQYLREMGA
jgi:hypothetical protein